MRPPTQEEIEAAKHLHGDPIEIAAATKRNRPAGLHKRPTGRPRKDGQPPHRTAAALEKERQAAAAAVALATNHAEPIKDKNAFLPDTIAERVKNLQETGGDLRACTFLSAFAEYGYRNAAKMTQSTPVDIATWKASEAFRRIYDAIEQARDAATVARTCGTLAELANGDYKPKPDCLPPDTRAASLLLPALDPRFRAGQQGNAQQVQINISI